MPRRSSRFVGPRELGERVATGLAADLVAGGLTLGGGMLAGAVLGGLSGVGGAELYNRVQSSGSSEVRWKPEFIAQLSLEAAIRYLAVAHHGRGRDDFRSVRQEPRIAPVLSDL